MSLFIYQGLPDHTFASEYGLSAAIETVTAILYCKNFFLSFQDLPRVMMFLLLAGTMKLKYSLGSRPLSLQGQIVLYLAQHL